LRTRIENVFHPFKRSPTAGNSAQTNLHSLMKQTFYSRQGRGKKLTAMM
jgi:hypothetical protein